jgi:GDP-L-fucose synthase
MIENKKILNTSKNGLLGSAISRKLECDSISRNDIDLCEKPLKEFLLGKEYDIVIHSAAKVGGVGANMEDNYNFFHKNLKLDDNVLNYCFENNVDQLVTILSTCMFSPHCHYPLTKDQVYLGTPDNSNYGYSYAKRLLNIKTNYYSKVINKNWLSIVSTNLYGINDNFHINNSHIIPALIRKAHHSATTGEKLEIWGDGTPLRQFLFSDDLADIIIWALENWKYDSPLMAINEKEYSISEVVEIICNRFNISKSMVYYDKNKPNGVAKKPALSDLNSFKFTDLETGINKTIDWYLENYTKNTIRL